MDMIPKAEKKKIGLPATKGKQMKQIESKTKQNEIDNKRQNR